jgi:hypothetical protein
LHIDIVLTYRRCHHRQLADASSTHLSMLLLPAMMVSQLN